MNKQRTTAKANYKLHEPQRYQVEIQIGALDDCLEANHKARAIWDCVMSMNTNPCFRHLKSLVSCPGRKATNPEVLFALWLLALTDNVVSSRAIEELSKKHDAYKWIRGGVPINHDMLCKFRSLSPEIFEDLLTSCLALMQSQDLLNDIDFAQDGTRIQSAAGRSSGRRKKTLLEQQEAAKKHLKELEQKGGCSADDLTRRQEAARLAAARDRKARLDKASEELKKAKEVKRESCRKKKEEIEKDVANVRITPTDPEARMMKMGNGGFTLAHNLQVVTGTKSRVIYRVFVSNSLDQGKAPRMLAQTKCMLKRIGAPEPEPKNWICDAAYSTKNDIEGCYELSPTCNAVFASKPNKGSDPTKSKKKDGPGMERWRKSLNTEEFADTYSQRCMTVELSNARLKLGGLSRFSLTGSVKATSEALLSVLAHNVSIWIGAIADMKPINA